SKTSMSSLRKKSLLLTGYLEHLLDEEIGTKVRIITPRDPEQRGCQLSLLFERDMETVFRSLLEAGVVCDERKPDCIRIAPVPLYNSFEDVRRFVTVLGSIISASDVTSSA